MKDDSYAFAFRLSILLARALLKLCYMTGAAATEN